MYERIVECMAYEVCYSTENNINVYNCVGRTVLRSSMGCFLGVSLGGGTRWDERITVGMEPGGITVASMGNYIDVRVRI